MEDRSTRFGLDPYMGQELSIWQGTVIANSKLNTRLVVSADCDLASDKSGGSFFFLDVVPASEFVRNYVIPDTLEARLEVVLDEAKNLVVQRNNAFSQVAPRVLFDWLTRGHRKRWLSDLPGAHPAEIDLLEALANASLQLDRSKQGSDVEEGAKNECRAVYLDCTNSQQQKKIDALNKKIKDLIQSRLQSTRLDHFILPDIPGISGSGHYVPFRSVQAMARDNVCNRRTELVEFREKYYPIATCRPVLLQSLLQKFMTYFMRIGFTDTFKSQQDRVVKETLGVVQ
jgi:hypothetical protein